MKDIFFVFAVLSLLLAVMALAVHAFAPAGMFPTWFLVAAGAIEGAVIWNTWRLLDSNKEGK